MHSEHHCHIVLDLNAERVIPLHNYKVLGKFLDRIDDVGWFDVAWFLSVNVKDLEGILDNSLEGAIHAIFTINKLDKIAKGVADCSIVTSSNALTSQC
jgi:hypothetical protein